MVDGDQQVGLQGGKFFHQRRRQPVAVNHAVGHRMRHPRRAEQAQAAHADRAGGGAIAIEIADHHDMPVARHRIGQQVRSPASMPPITSGGSSCASLAAPVRRWRRARHKAAQQRRDRRASPTVSTWRATDPRRSASCASARGLRQNRQRWLRRMLQARRPQNPAQRLATRPAHAASSGCRLAGQHIQVAHLAQVDQRVAVLRIAAHSRARPPHWRQRRAAAMSLGCAPAGNACARVRQHTTTPEPQRIDRRLALRGAHAHCADADAARPALR